MSSSASPMSLRKTTGSASPFSYFVPSGHQSPLAAHYSQGLKFHNDTSGIRFSAPKDYLPTETPRDDHALRHSSYCGKPAIISPIKLQLFTPFMAQVKHFTCRERTRSSFVQTPSLARPVTRPVASACFLSIHPAEKSFPSRPSYQTLSRSVIQKRPPHVQRSSMPQSLGVAPAKEKLAAVYFTTTNPLSRLSTVTVPAGGHVWLKQKKTACTVDDMLRGAAFQSAGFSDKKLRIIKNIGRLMRTSTVESASLSKVALGLGTRDSPKNLQVSSESVSLKHRALQFLRIGGDRRYLHQATPFG